MSSHCRSWRFSSIIIQWIRRNNLCILWNDIWGCFLWITRIFSRVLSDHLWILFAKTSTRTSWVRFACSLFQKDDGDIRVWSMCPKIWMVGTWRWLWSWSSFFCSDDIRRCPFWTSTFMRTKDPMDDMKLIPLFEPKDCFGCVRPPFGKCSCFSSVGIGIWLFSLPHPTSFVTLRRGVFVTPLFNFL